MLTSSFLQKSAAKAHVPEVQEENPDFFNDLLREVELDPSDPALKKKDQAKKRPLPKNAPHCTQRVALSYPYIVAYSVVDAVKFFDNTLNVSTRQLHSTDDTTFQVRSSFFVECACF